MGEYGCNIVREPGKPKSPQRTKPLVELTQAEWEIMKVV
jgi:hypothetical protein